MRKILQSSWIRIIGAALLLGWTAGARADGPSQNKAKQFSSLARAAIAKINSNIQTAKDRLNAAPGSIPASTGHAFDAVRGEQQSYDKFTWVRDSAIVARKLNLNDDRQAILDYANFNKQLQNSDAPAGLGEPKFYSNGGVFRGAWGRPQNDGPAQRAITISQFASAFLSQGSVDTARDLFNIVTRDLNYIVGNFDKESFDAWEESKGFHFHVLVDQRNALYFGQKLARELGVQPPPEWNLVANEIERWLPEFRDFANRIIVATRGPNGSLANNGRSDFDALIFMSLTTTDYGPPNSEFTVSSPWVMGTVEKFRREFEVGTNSFSINHQGIHSYVGRYPGDNYFGGNIWPITNFALADYYYQVGIEVERRGLINVTPVNFEFLQRVANGANLEIGTTISRNSPKFAQIINGLVNEGDKAVDDMLQLIGVRFDPTTNEMIGELDINEQYSKTDGQPCALPNLTWNYAVLYQAIQSRERLMTILPRLQSEHALSMQNRSYGASNIPCSNIL